MRRRVSSQSEMDFRAYGAIESDYRPKRWNSFREDYKFTGKEADIEAGVTYFGARYYQAHLGRWMSPDPLNIHGLSGDPNPYAYLGGRTVNAVDPIGLDDEAPPWAGSCTADVT